MKYLITGGCGFIGSNLALKVLDQGHELVVLDNLFRHGSASNLQLLRSKGDFVYYPYDIRNQNDVNTVIEKELPDVVFHLAGQVAMTTSIDNPRMDFEINVMGTFNVLDAVRRFVPDSPVLYSSSNKVYGDFDYLTFEEQDTRYTCLEYPNGFDESIKLEFHSPYGCSKGAADQYLLDFARIYGLKTVVFRHSSMYGGLQHATIDQGWVGWFCQKAIDIKNGMATEPFTISGNGKQVRDVLHADDVVSLYFKAVQNIEKVRGRAFNIGGGIENSLSLLELFAHLEKALNITMEFEQLRFRESDQLFFVADNTAITNCTGWRPEVDTNTGLRKMLKWLKGDA
jgi:CDP-paratose 2-epimerase